MIHGWGTLLPGKKRKKIKMKKYLLEYQAFELGLKAEYDFNMRRLGHGMALQFDWTVLCTQQGLVDRWAGYGEARRSRNTDI